MYSFTKLKYVAKLMSPKEFKKSCVPTASMESHSFIFVPKQFTGIFSIFHVRESLPENCGDGTIVMLKDENSSVITFTYLSFFLNSIAGKVLCAFDNDKKIYRKTITKKNLSECIIVYPPDKSIQNYYGAVQSILEKEATENIDNKDKYSSLRIDMYAELRDSLAIELAMSDDLKKYDINIFEQWKSLWDKCQESKNTHTVAYNDLIRPDSATMQQVKKLRIVMINNQQIQSKVSEHVENQ